MRQTDDDRKKERKKALPTRNGRWGVLEEEKLKGEKDREHKYQGRGGEGSDPGSSKRLLFRAASR
jgi:hypothetical protein